MENQHNYLTGHVYEGVDNLRVLLTAIKKNGYNSNEWITFLQAKGLGLKIKKGSRGVKIFRGFASVEEKNKEGKIKAKSVPLGWHTVFNIEQTEKIKRQIK